ncbi:MATE efflux family protein [Abeliophyllum distichum]|uniref:Protein DETOXIFICATION n=1 Tax=Abeliophyllum distichum TaxID=126358 RepID=A0ABD1SST7_9LAMI
MEDANWDLKAHSEGPLQETNQSSGADEDIQPIKTVKDFVREFSVESIKLWYLAGPAVFTSIFQYSIGFITQTLAGHVGTIQLAAISIEINVFAGIAFGVMLGMGSALETLCGQAYGAGKLDMLGVYMQRSWLILNISAIPVLFLYIFADPIMNLIGQTPEISKWVGIFSLLMIPELFAYALNFPIQKFLQSQSKILAMAAISAAAVILHTIFSWLLMLKLKWGLGGAALMLNFSWWFMVVAQLLYIFSGTCGEAWSGFSWKAFQHLWGFVKLSLASAVMICLEVWYFVVLILFAGYLKNAKVAVDALSICINLVGWAVMLAIGFNAAISVRVSNELGAGRPRTAKFSVVVVSIFALLFGIFLALILMAARSQYPALFSNNKEVQKVVYDLTPLVAFSIIVNTVQPTFSGVAIGAGWQTCVAYVNVACYYLFGIPLGIILGYVLHMGVKGIWYGMLSGTALQTCVLFWIIYRTDWNKEASFVRDRIKQWGGEYVPQETQIERSA